MNWLNIVAVLCIYAFFNQIGSDNNIIPTEQMNLAAYKDKEEKHADLLLNAHEMKVSFDFYHILLFSTLCDIKQFLCKSLVQIS